MPASRQRLSSAGLSPESPGWILAIDTSSDRAGIALYDGEALHEHTWPASRAQTTQVLSRVHRLLDDVGLTTADLGGIAVAIGPGTFTGLRVGLSLAKGLAMAHGIPFVGVPTLDATALPFTRASLDVIAVLPAGRGRLVWQRVDPGSEPVNGTPDELVDAIGRAPVDVVVGELPAPLRLALAGMSIPVLAKAGLTSRIGAIALLGHQRLVGGDADDLATLEPIYVHGTPKAIRPVRDARA